MSGLITKPLIKPLLDLVKKRKRANPTYNVETTEKNVLSGESGRITKRLGIHYRKPFQENHTAECVSKLADLNALVISDEVTSTIHRLTGGNPFYIWCLLCSKCLTDKQLTTSERLLEIYEYEMNQNNGSLRIFWDGHFSNENNLNSEDTGLKAMYFLSLHPGEYIEIHQIANAIGESPSQTKNILQNFSDDDLVANKLHWRYVGIIDPVLGDYIKRVYQEQIEKQSSQ